jgi:hypothetical protein
MVLQEGPDKSLMVLAPEDERAKCLVVVREFLAAEGKGLMADFEP